MSVVVVPDALCGDELTTYYNRYFYPGEVGGKAVARVTVSTGLWIRPSAPYRQDRFESQNTVEMDAIGGHFFAKSTFDYRKLSMSFDRVESAAQYWVTFKNGDILITPPILVDETLYLGRRFESPRNDAQIADARDELQTLYHDWQNATQSESVALRVLISVHR
jgi:hypothetical protein